MNEDMPWEYHLYSAEASRRRPDTAGQLDLDKRTFVPSRVAACKVCVTE